MPFLGIIVPMSFANNLRREMEYQDIQVKELSQRTGISKNTLDKYLSGSQSLPSVEKAAKIAKALNVSVEYLLSAEENITKRDPEISQEDLNILTSYRKLSREKKELIKSLIEVMLKKA